MVGEVNLGRNEIPKTSSTILLRPSRHTDPEFFCCEVEDVTDTRQGLGTWWDGALVGLEGARPAVEGKGDEYTDEKGVHGGREVFWTATRIKRYLRRVDDQRQRRTTTGHGDESVKEQTRELKE